MMIKRIFILLSVVSILLTCFVMPASAQTYSTDYPSVGNSGSPLWLHCEVEGRGTYLIVLDPNTNPQAFGFDTPKNGYNLINNTGSTIVGRAYSTNNSGACSVRWPSYYCLTLKLGYDQNGNQTQYVEGKITQIYGTTLDLIDYTGTRGNDLYKYDLERPELIIVITLVIIVFVLVYQFHFKSRLMRM